MALLGGARRGKTSWFAYSINTADNSASFFFNGKPIGGLHLPYLNESLEETIKFARSIEKAYLAYDKAVTGGKLNF